MDYQTVYQTYKELKEALVVKKQCIIEKNLEKLSSTDEEIVVLCEKIQKFDLKNKENNFTQEQKQELKSLGQEIKAIEENNEILIKHSLSVINNMLSGILNIVQTEKTSYDSKGIGRSSDESLNISSITEEA